MYTFETERLILRPFAPNDWQDLYEYEAHPETLKFVTTDWKCTEDDAKSLAEQWSKNESTWAVCLKDVGKVIGHVDIRPEYEKRFCVYEIGYIFSPMYHGKGYATEAVRRIIRHGFEDLHAHRIISDSFPEHTASWRLLERLGLRREAHFVKSWPFGTSPDGQTNWMDVYFYGILKSEWSENEAVKNENK